MQNQIKIGHQFFVKAKNDYSNWKFAIAREFIQNSIDARSSKIKVDVTLNSNGTTTVVVEDNGCGMSKDVLINKLLSLGESGKDFSGTVGGFGKAKEILYFCHKSYHIHTNDLIVSGCGAQYDLVEASPIKGTVSTIVVEGDYYNDLIGCFKAIIAMTQWGGVFVLNGVEYDARMRKGSFRKELDWCKIYTNKTFQNRLIVRIGGIVMFHRHVDADDRCVIVELTKSSEEILQSSRDYLKCQYQSQLDELVRKLTVDKDSAFRSDTIYYEHFKGDKLKNEDRGEVAAMVALAKELSSLADEATAREVEGPQTMSGGETPIAEADGTNVQDVSETTLGSDRAPVLAARTGAAQPTRMELVRNFRHEFIVKNNAGMQIPDYYRPGQFSEYSDKLVRCWVKLLLETYRTFGKCEPFCVGFVFEEQVLAEFEKSSDYGRVFYINPAKIVKTSTGVRVLAKRWGFTWNMKYQLIISAVHEYVHSCGYDYHDERFVKKSDDCMAVVMKNIKRFRACFE